MFVSDNPDGCFYYCRLLVVNGKNVYVFLGVHSNLVRKEESVRYLRCLGDREDGVIQNSDDHRCAARREEEIQGQEPMKGKWLI